MPHTSQPVKRPVKFNASLENARSENVVRGISSVQDDSQSGEACCTSANESTLNGSVTGAPLPEGEKGRLNLSELLEKGPEYAVQQRSLFQKYFRNCWCFGVNVVSSIVIGIIFLITGPVVAAMIKRDSDGPVFYRQTRVGRGGRHFQVLKFRTMVSDAEKDGPRWSSVGDERITKFGKKLRSTRIDEMPQILSVMKGDMAFIGPRPERPAFVKELSEQIPHYDIRHRIKPGLTGWAQVSYPYGSSIEDAENKLSFDLFYMKNASVLLDLKIVGRTFSVVFSKSGV